MKISKRARATSCFVYMYREDLKKSKSYLLFCLHVSRVISRAQANTPAKAKSKSNRNANALLKLRLRLMAYG